MAIAASAACIARPGPEASFASTHHCAAHFTHDRANVSEVEVDETFLHHQIGNAGNAGIENLVSHGEGIGKGRLVVGNAEEVLVRNDDQRIDGLLQFLDALFGKTHAATAFEMERLGNDADRQDALVAGSLCNDRCSTGARTTTHAGSDEAHVGAVQVIDDLIDAFFSGGASDFRLGTGTETLGDVDAELDDPVCLRHGQSLCIRVGDDEIDTLEASRDHVVDSVTATAADTENSDAWLQLGDIRLLQLYRHFTIPSFSGRIAPLADS